jgi:hypothetical protein
LKGRVVDNSMQGYPTVEQQAETAGKKGRMDDNRGGI